MHLPAGTGGVGDGGIGTGGVGDGAGTGIRAGFRDGRIARVR